MAKIPLPERGQPIDVSYLYQIINAINQISDQLVTTGFNYTTIDTTSGKQNIPTTQARIIGGSVQIITGEQAAGSTKTFTYAFNGNFKYTPIATATVVDTRGGAANTAGEGATVIITSIDANGLSGLVRFDKQGAASTTVNLIIVGIPN
jgi:hypothetical protein